MENKSVILFFARTATAEMQVKKLCSKRESINNQLHHFLYKKSLTELYKTGLPVFVCDESKQQGNNFGSRIHNAIQACFNNGYNSVITVGSDCPELKAEDILHCHRELNKGNNVLGPDNRGGIYLMGIQQKFFSVIDLLHIEWNSTKVLSQLKSSFLNSSTDIYLLNTLTDVNSQKDFFYLFKQAANNIFLIILHDILHSKSLHFLLIQHFISPLQFLANKKFRGPPTMFLYA